MTQGPTADHGLLRPPEGGHHAHRVTFVELFFDLVFVFAITQISHSLIAHQDLTTLVQTVVLTLAVWWVWVYTTWVTNWLDPDNGPVRAMLFTLMLLGLLMSSAIPEAFGDRALLFAGAMVAMQVGRSVFAVLAFRRYRPDNAVNFVRISIWLAASGVFWVVGALVPDGARLGVWLVAIAIDLSAPRLRYWVPRLGRSSVETWDVSGEHMAERVSLFLIIVLGESIIVTGSAFADLPLTGLSVLSFLAAFASTVLMWLLFFNHGERGGSTYISAASERGLIAQVAYTYIPVVLVIGILLTAVADEVVLLHPLGHEHDGHASGVSDLFTALLVCGASAVYLIGNLLFKRAVGGPWLMSHLVGAVALLGLVAAYPLLPPLALSWLANLVLLVVVVADERGFRRDLPSLPPLRT